jgi:cobalamin biosynthesis Mg chelatase CobN
MPKRRPTIPIAHADDVPTIAFTDEEWQAIEHAYARQLNAGVRQQITKVTTQYLKDCAFERTAAPKAMARERIERIRRAAGDLEKVMLDSKTAAKETQQAPTAEPAAEPSPEETTPVVSGGTTTAETAATEAPAATEEASTDELSREQQEQQQQSVHSYTDRLIRRHFNDPRLAAGWRGDHFRGVLTSLVVACDCALNDLSAPEGYGQPWDWWIQALTQIAQEHGLPAGARIVGASGEPSPFVALVRALQGHVSAKHTHSDEALAKAIQRAQSRARDK